MIEIVSLSKIFNQNKPNAKKALDNVSVTIDNGEMLAVMGASGAGKSTLMNVLGSLDVATDGKVIVNGCDLSAADGKSLAKYRCNVVGIVTQQPFLIENASALENVSVPLLNTKIKRADRNVRCIQILKRLGLDEFIKTNVSVLSGGERQRVAVARALINDPDIILADEPTGALDNDNSAKIMAMFEKIHQSGKTVIIVTHDQEIAAYCHRIITLSDGQIISDTK